MLDSALATATHEFEVVAWFDDDDPTRDQYPVHERVRYGSGPRQYNDEGVLTTSGLWARAWEMGSGGIAFLGADDIIFETPGWDRIVEDVFAAVPDGILMAYPDDGTPRQAPVNPFISRRWIELAGFTPPDFQGWFADEWIWAIAAELERVAFLTGVKIPHLQKTRSDQTYRDGHNARRAVGGLAGMKERFYSAEITERRDELTAKLRAAMDGPTIVPEPQPGWFQESVTLSQAARGARTRTSDTLVVVHCYAGDQHLVEAFLPQYLHHGCDVLLLSPADAPVEIDRPGVTCCSAGKAAYFGQASLDRQRRHLELLLETDYTYFLLNDSDSVCLSPELPAYLYEQPEFVWSNEVKEMRPHASPYPKIAFHPPYFLTRTTIERFLTVNVKAHPITPFIDWYMVALTYESGLEHRAFPDGKSFPAWRHGLIPETTQLGHNYVHEIEARGADGGRRMAQQVGRGVVMVHSVKHPEVMTQLIAAHTRYRHQRQVRDRRAASRLKRSA